MYRRYTIHRDGDLLVEDLDPSGKPVDAEPVLVEDRLPYEVVVLAPDGAEARERVLELLEAVYELEQGDPGGFVPGGSTKLPVVS